MSIPARTIRINEIEIKLPHSYETVEHYNIHEMFLTELRFNSNFRNQVVEILLPDLKGKISSLLLELE